MGSVLSLSSCWCSHRHDDGYAMLQEMVDLGFSHVELSHGIKLTLVPGILKAFEEGWVQVSSTHNFCPLPPGVNQAAPNVFQPTGPSQVEQQMWMRHSVQTLQFAQRLGAAKVIMHSGSCWFFWGSPAKAVDALEAEVKEKKNLREMDAFVRVRDRALLRMRQPVAKAMARLVPAMQGLIPAARDHGVTLCLENREGFTELPMDGAWVDYLTALGDVPEARYWHDTGHAQIKDLMGLLEHESHLEGLASRLVGWHLHDVNAAGRDHQTIGTGLVPWDRIKRFFQPQHTFVLELSPRLTVEQVLESKRVAESFLP